METVANHVQLHHSLIHSGRPRALLKADLNGYVAWNATHCFSLCMSELHKYEKNFCTDITSLSFGGFLNNFTTSTTS